MSDVSSILLQARSALTENDSKKALKILKPLKKTLQAENSGNLELKETYAEAYLEHGELEKAYPLLVQACELDPNGTEGGCDKFFTLGQIVGGRDGLAVITQGIENVSTITGDSLTQEQVNKIVSGLLTMIEIWMTDLCMEPEAESECENLINQAMKISENSSPDAWVILGSIRISQQRFGESCTAFTKAWESFEVKKNNISESLAQGNTASHEEYVDMLQPLLALTKMCIEVGLYDIALKVVTAAKDIDEDNIESYYLEGFTYYLISKIELFKQSNPGIKLTADNIYDFNSKIQELPLDLNNQSIAESVHDSRLALSYASRLGENISSSDEISREFVTGAHTLLEEIGGPVSSEELETYRKGDSADADAEELDLDEFSEIAN